MAFPDSELNSLLDKLENKFREAFEEAFHPVFQALREFEEKMTSPSTSAPPGFQERPLHETASTNGELDPSPGLLLPVTVTHLLEIVQPPMVSMTDINPSPSVLNPKPACTNEPEDVNPVTTDPPSHDHLTSAICLDTSINVLPHLKDCAPPGFYNGHGISEACSFRLDPGDWDEILSPIRKGISEICERRASPPTSQAPGCQNEAVLKSEFCASSRDEPPLEFSLPISVTHQSGIVQSSGVSACQSKNPSQSNVDLLHVSLSKSEDASLIITGSNTHGNAFATNLGKESVHTVENSTNGLLPANPLLSPSISETKSSLPRAFSHKVRGENEGLTADDRSNVTAVEKPSLLECELGPLVFNSAAPMHWNRKGPDIHGDVRLSAASLNMALVPLQCILVFCIALQSASLVSLVRMAEGRDAYGRLRLVRRPWF